MPPKSKTGLVVGLVLGGLALLLLLVIGGAILAANSGDDDLSIPGTTIGTGVTLAPSTTRSTRVPTTSAIGSTTSIAGTGPASSVTATQAAGFLKEEQEKALPDVTVDSAKCPPEPYNVGHVIICRLVLQGTPVLYEVEISDVESIRLKPPLMPIIDTDKAEALIETQEAGVQPDCGSPRIRQVEVGATFSCTTTSGSWEFTVKDENGQVSGSRS
ncbi:MAG: hypothetical protein WKF86_07260 [Acidimicrobiales bacterium]